MGHTSFHQIECGMSLLKKVSTNYVFPPPSLVGREIYRFRALRLSGWRMDGCHKVCLRFFSLTVYSILMKLHMHSWYQV